ncbi:MAG: hypothetical protein H7Y16_09660 [Candidatus Parcubacteria bacterium]|nr:hypothetical protein [Burkholderiales bacterium]
MSAQCEVVEHEGVRFAEIIWAGAQVSQSRFFSQPESSFQFGLLARPTGFLEAAHFHKPLQRKIDDLQQMFVVQSGVVAVAFYDRTGAQFREVVLRAGDAINLVHGAHSIRIIEDLQAISVKQGPFLGDENDKVEIARK